MANPAPTKTHWKCYATYSPLLVLSDQWEGKPRMYLKRAPRVRDFFRWNDVPYVFLSCGRWQHYHQSTDTPDRLNYRKMAAIAVYAESVCRGAATAELETFIQAQDPIAFEAKTWVNALGMLYKAFAAVLRVPDFRTRSNVNKAVRALKSLGL